MTAATTLRVLPLLLMLFSACSGTSFSVHADHDEAFDFAKAKTFDFLQGGGASTVVRDLGLLGFVEKALVSRGLSRSTRQPDLLVAVHRTIEGSLHTQKSGYEVRSGRIARYTLQEGTLVVDLVSADKKESVWRGTATGAFRDDLAPSEREKLLTEVMNEMFADFPPR